MSNTLIGNKAKIRGHKETIFAIAIIAILAISTFAVLIPHVSASTPITIPNYVYINAFPTPDGVNQPISLFCWSAALPPTANGEYGDRWTNLTVTVTLPDGTTTTLGPYKSDPVGTIFETYVPTETGNYTFQFHMPAYTITDANPNPSGYDPAPQFLGDIMAAADSTVVTVDVTNTPVPGAPTYPLPTEYWTNPVSQSGHALNWEYVMGDWLANGIVLANINDYTTPVTTAHIAWTKPITINGGVGTLPSAISQSEDAFYSYLSYETNFNPGIIMNGQLYYNTAVPPEYGFVDVDLRTGQQMWYNNGTQDPLAVKQPYGSFGKQNYPQLSFGQDILYISPNQSGELSYLWATYTMSNGSTVWSMYDPGSGNWIMDIVGVPAGGTALNPDPNGDYCVYTLNAAAGTLSVFNDTQCVLADAASASQTNGYWMWRPQLGGEIPASWGTTVYKLTGSVPSNIAQDSLEYMDAADQVAIYGNVSYGITGSQGTINYPSPSAYSMVEISINPSNIGQVIWSQTYPWPQGQTLNTASNAIGSGVFATFTKETRIWAGYSVATGAQLWTTAATPEIGNHMYDASYTGAETTGFYYDGMLVQGDGSGSGGNVYAYNMTTGALLWDYQSPPMDNTGYWANIPVDFAAGGAGNLYFYGSEHSPSAPLESGMQIVDINATTGSPIWNITFWDSGGAKFALSDGYGVALNAYDQQIYSFGMGPTKTTVETPLTDISQGQTITIQGSVLDISAGTTQANIAPRFPNGVAAVSDASMRDYMEYVYMQNPVPSNTTGVPVQVTLIDPNGNSINLPTVTSDMDGHYSLSYNANGAPGLYTAIATFKGTDAYWPSYSESSFTVTPASAATPAPTSTPTSVADTYFMPMSIGIIVLIIIVLAAVMLLMLRKHP